MTNRILPLLLGTLTGGFLLGATQTVSAQGFKASRIAGPDELNEDRLKAGAEMPFHVVDLYGGALNQTGKVRGRKNPVGGSPPVIISNSRLPGLEVWCLAPNEQILKLAEAIDQNLTKSKRSNRVFFVLLADAETPDFQKRFVELKLKNVHLGIPRSSTQKVFAMTDQSRKEDLLIFQLDGKMIKKRLENQASDLDAAKIEKLTLKLSKFFRRSK